MSFESRLSIGRSSRTGQCVSASVVPRGRNSKLRLSVSFNGTIMKLIPFRRCDVFVGDGEDEGKLKLTFREGGEHYLKPRGLGALLILNSPDCVPADWLLASALCEVRWQPDSSLVVTLPIAFWEKAIGTHLAKGTPA